MKRIFAVVAAGLTVALSLLLGFTQQEITTASAAARQSTTFADVYTDGSEMDADLTQMTLLGGDPASFQADSKAVDDDLRQAGSPSDLDFTAYRADAYAQATTLAQFTLLPAARSDAGAQASRMSEAVRRERVLKTAGTAVAGLLGLVLVLLAGRSPLMIAGFLLAAVSITLFQLGDARLHAGTADISRFLAQARAEGAAFDVAADPARYLVTGRDPTWSADAANEERQIPGAVTGEARIEWVAYEGTVSGLFAGIDDRRISAADLSPSNVPSFNAFRALLLASEEKTVLDGGDRLSAARTLYIVWYVLPIASMAVILFLAGRVRRA